MEKGLQETTISRMGLTEWTLLFVLSIFWGGSFFFIEVCLQSMPPMTVTTMRLLLAALFLNIFRKLAGLPFPKDKTVIAKFFILGLFNNAIPFSLLIWGQTSITGGTAALLVAATPFFTILIAHVFTQDEKISGAKFLGVLIGLGGVSLIVSTGSEDNALIGKLAVLGTAFVYACAGVYGRTLRKYRIHPVTAATGQISFAAAIMIPFMCIIDKPWNAPLPSQASIIALLLMSFFTTALAYIIYFRILSSSGATNVLLVTFLNPASALLLGALFIGEQISLLQILGILVIGLGLLCVDGRLMTKRSPATGV